MGTSCMFGVYRDQKRLFDPLELELHIVVSSHVGARNQRWVLSAGPYMMLCKQAYPIMFLEPGKSEGVGLGKK